MCTLRNINIIFSFFHFFFQKHNQTILKIYQMEIQKGKLCLSCKLTCGNATKKCSCGFDFNNSKEEEDHMDTESGSEDGSESGSQNDEEDPCEFSSDEDNWSYDDESEEEEEEESDPAWRKRNGFAGSWENFKYKEGFTKKWNWKSPYECFSEIWDASIMKELVTQTNNYGKAKYRSKWETVTEQIMKWWLSIVFGHIFSSLSWSSS